MRHTAVGSMSYWQPPARGFDPDPPDHDLPDRSRLALTVGIVSLLVGPLGIVAWALADACLKGIANGQLDPAGEGNARAAKVLGIVATCMFLVKLASLLPLVAYVSA
jgi:hypothetical protein